MTQQFPEEQQTPPYAAAPAGAGMPVAPYAPPGMMPMGNGPVGKVRNTGTCFLLMIVTLGFYSLFWYGGVHSDMKRHTGVGIGGGLAVVLAFFVGFVSPFLASGDVGNLYARAGRHKPVSGVTGLWCFLPFVGMIIWFVKTNGALNAYWRSLGAS